VRRLSLTGWIFVGMAVGVALGLAAPEFSRGLAPVSNIFLRLIRSIIAPLLFATLVYGIAGTGSMKAMGRIGLKAIVYFESSRRRPCWSGWLPSTWPSPEWV